MLTITFFRFSRQGSQKMVGVTVVKKKSSYIKKKGFFFVLDRSDMRSVILCLLCYLYIITLSYGQQAVAHV